MVNTTYNYRARIKAGALCTREEFETKVKEPGGTPPNKKSTPGDWRALMAYNSCNISSIVLSFIFPSLNCFN